MDGDVMGSISSLYIGVSGLNSSQNALNVTAHNLTNVDTKGYVRQQVLSKDFGYNTIGETHTSLSQLGLGTSIDVVRQVRDVFLDQSYRQELGRQGFYESQYEAIGEIEGLFGELEGVAFQDSLLSMWTSIQELAKEPDNGEKRATVISKAESFLERASNIATQLQKYQLDLNTQIIDKVDRINKIGDGIDKLNYKIALAESTGVQHANDLRDQRNNLLDELSQLVKISYKENATGVVTVSIEGTQFVSDENVYHLATTPVSDDSQMLKPIWAASETDLFDMSQTLSAEANTDIGSLKGLLVARGDRIANYTDVPVAPEASDYPTTAAYNIALNQYNTDVEEYEKTTQTSVIMSAQAKFDQLIHSVVTTINDILSPNVNLTLADGTTIKVLDEANAPVGTDKDKTPGEALFNRKSPTMPRYTQTTVNVLAPDGVTVVPTTVYKYNEEDENDNYSLFTLGEIEINQDIMKNNGLLPISSADGTGAYDIDICNKLTEAWNKKDTVLGPETLTKNNFMDYYTAMIGEIANKGEAFKNTSEDQADMAEYIDNQRMQVAGTSSDEELTNLIKYQHAYNAAARYINVIDEMLEHIVTSL